MRKHEMAKMSIYISCVVKSAILFILRQINPSVGMENTNDPKRTMSQLRVCAEISSQIFRVQAPVQQGTKMQEYLAYVEFS